MLFNSSITVVFLRCTCANSTSSSYTVAPDGSNNNTISGSFSQIAILSVVMPNRFIALTSASAWISSLKISGFFKHKTACINGVLLFSSSFTLTSVPLAGVLHIASRQDAGGFGLLFLPTFRPAGTKRKSKGKSKDKNKDKNKDKSLDCFVEKDLLIKKLSDRHGSSFAGRLLIAVAPVASNNKTISGSFSQIAKEQPVAMPYRPFDFFR